MKLLLNNLKQFYKYVNNGELTWHVYSQDVADNSYTPHVCSVTDGLVINHLWSHKLWGAKKDFQRSSILYSHT